VLPIDGQPRGRGQAHPELRLAPSAAMLLRCALARLYANARTAFAAGKLLDDVPREIERITGLPVYRGCVTRR
jgi:hypothetical protein